MISKKAPPLLKIVSSTNTINSTIIEINVSWSVLNLLTMVPPFCASIGQFFPLDTS